ncbi:MAG: molecular chaperone DnaJ [Gemmatimonadales bacterium]
MKQDFYELLGVRKNCDDAELKKAYRKLAMECHPDRNNGDKSAEERFKLVSEAYEVLRDPNKRAAYDRYGIEGIRGGGQGGFSSMHFDLSEALMVFMRDFGLAGGGAGGGASAFESLFGGGGRRDRRRGHDIKVGLKLTLAEVASGATKTMRIKSLETCPICAGTGAKAGTQPVQCGSCGGTGEVRRQAQSLFGQFLTVSPCPTCGGEGTMVQNPCDRCGGDGRVKGEKTIQIDVPAGVADHHYLTLRGQGAPGPRNGPRGDLIAVLDIKEDPRFERHGDDLVYDLGITFTQAALGGEIDVPTPFGQATLRIEPGTQTGMAYRLRAKGLPRLGEGGHGDLHVRIHVWTPTKLNVEQRKLLETLREIEDAPPEEESGSKFWDTIRRALGLEEQHEARPRRRHRTGGGSDE